jgi:hypothetical protein
MALESTQPLTEMKTRNLPGGKGRPARKAHLTAICLENVGASMSYNPMGLHGLLQGQLYSYTGMDARIRMEFALFRSSLQYKHLTEINSYCPIKRTRELADITLHLAFIS